MHSDVARLQIDVRGQRGIRGIVDLDKSKRGACAFNNPPGLIRCGGQAGDFTCDVVRRGIQFTPKLRVRVRHPSVQSIPVTGYERADA